MSPSTNLISGLSSGFDWRTMVDQLIAVDHSRVDVISTKKTDTEAKLKEWQSVNTKLLALKTSAGNLKHPDDFSVYKAFMTSSSATVNAADLLTVTASETASVGSYTLKVNTLAASQKMSSASFTSASAALGAGHAGDMLINGTVITVTATDTLNSVKDRINDANSGDSPTGVTAGVVSYGTGDYRLILTSDTTGSAGIGLLNGGAADILNQFGFTDTSRTAKNHLAGGDRTDRFTSTSLSIKSLLGLTTTQTAAAKDIIINGIEIDAAIDFSVDTLSSLQTKLNDAGLSASIVTETDDNQVYYRLMVAGAANTYTDKNNIIETLGLIKGGVSDVAGVTGDVANTAGGAVIISDTLLKDIDGYTGYAAGDYIHLEGTDTESGSVSDDTLVLDEATTVGDLITKIRSVFGDVTASIGGDGKLMVVDDTPGASPLAVQISVKNFGGTPDDTLKFDGDGNLGSAATIRKRQVTAGADASVTVDGVTVTRPTNTIDDILSGVTLDLLKADADTTVTLSISRDTDAIMEKIKSFVTSYNSVSSYMRTQASYDPIKQQASGILFGDGTLASVKSDLTSILVQSVWGAASDFSTLGLVGVNVDQNGQLSVNDSKLRGYLATNFNDIQKLFSAGGTTSVPTLAYIDHDIKTKQGDYTVNITAAATKSVSAASDNTSLGGPVTLTITQGSTDAIVNLAGGMSMSQMVNAINSELTTVYTQNLVGSEQLYADSGLAAKITASTKWNSIYDSSQDPAGLVDGDVISFSGTTRNGVGVSGSYTISDCATDSVQGLLSSIETAFGNQVTAAIDASGRIVVSDKSPGSSSISLSLDTTQAHSLDFGTVLTTNTDGQKGRYAMDIAASADVGGHLVLTHNSYGSGNGFTIQQTDPVLHTPSYLLWTGADPIVTDGVDIAGTINGEAATGVGQTLKGNSGDASVDGLVVEYTGAATGDVGTVKLTFGVAELYDRSLFNITDSLEGYVSYKQESVQNNISGYETQIQEMEARLDRKREMLIDRFVKMELALQTIQSQSNWLTGQLNAASSGWMKE